MFSEIVSFKQQLGHSDETQKYAKNPKIRGWARYQRSQYRLLKSGNKSSKSDEKIAKLERLGFKWNEEKKLALEFALNDHLSELIKFKQ